ncbi:MAG: glycosyltransferase, partial [Myxococcota bacterium]|nr:glycosyltransferase [Myxococcota bacterium]
AAGTTEATEPHPSQPARPPRRGVSHMESLIVWVDWFFLLYFLLMNTSYGVLILLAFWEVLLQRARWSNHALLWTEASPHIPPISILAPAYNEEETILDSVQALLGLSYPEYEVVIINDGSSDDTLRTLIDAFELFAIEPVCQIKLPSARIRALYRSRKSPRLLIVDKENGGKADALNCGLNVARYPLFCAIDADTLILPDALRKVAQPFIEDPVQTIVSGGTIRIANGCSISKGKITKYGLPANPWACFQVLEYLRAFLFGRIGWNSLGGTLIISGAFGLFRRDLVMDVGGYSVLTVGEDMELIVRLHKHMRQAGRPYRIHFVWASLCYTEVPESPKVLSRQRNRWQRGLIDSLGWHASLFMNPRYGSVGLLAFPFFFVFELIGPLLEVFGLILIFCSGLMGYLDAPFMLLFLSVSVFFGTLLSVGALFLEELSFGHYTNRGALLRLTSYALIENFGYRQLTLVWRIRGIWSAIRGQKQWGKMIRKGFQRVSSCERQRDERR